MDKQLIVNADDYGHTAGISKGIRKAHLNGIVTSTSVMMNRPDAVNAIQTAQRECPHLGLGLHLVLTTGKPLTPADQLSTLIDTEGFFLKADPFSEQISKIDLAQVNLEWRAQLQAFKSTAGCSPDHLDSHHHSSYFTQGLFELMLKLAQEENCAIRTPLGVDGTVFASGEPVSSFEQSLPRRAQVFFGTFYDEDATLENLNNILKSIEYDTQHNTFELMCHPAIVDDELRHTSVYNDKRADELTLLQSEVIKRTLHEKKIRLIRYADLNNGEVNEKSHCWF